MSHASGMNSLFPSFFFYFASLFHGFLRVFSVPHSLEFYFCVHIYGSVRCLVWIMASSSGSTTQSQSCNHIDPFIVRELDRLYVVFEIPRSIEIRLKEPGDTIHT